MMTMLSRDSAFHGPVRSMRRRNLKRISFLVVRFLQSDPILADVEFELRERNREIKKKKMR